MSHSPDFIRGSHGISLTCFGKEGDYTDFVMFFRLFVIFPSVIPEPFRLGTHVNIGFTYHVYGNQAVFLIHSFIFLSLVSSIKIFLSLFSQEL